MGRLQDAVRTWAQVDGATDPQFNTIDDDVISTYGFECAGDNETYKTFIDTNEETEVLAAYVYSPNKVPRKRRGEVAELLTRLNTTIINGCFDMDWDDGRFRCRAAIDVEDGQISTRMIENLYGACVAQMDQHYPSIMQSAFGNQSAQAVLQPGANDSAGRADAGPDKGTTLDWDALPGTGVLRQWAEELRAANGSGENGEWQLAGTAVFVEHGDTDECALIAERIAADLGYKMARLPADEVFAGNRNLRSRFRSMAPALVFVDDGDWQLRVDADKDESEIELLQGQRQFAEHLRDFDRANPVIIIACTRDRQRIAPRLLEYGVFDRVFVVPPLDKERLARLWLNELGESTAGPSLTEGLTKLGALLQNNFPTREERNLALLQCRRTARRLCRRIEFTDVMELVIRGAVEKDAAGQDDYSEAARRKTAIHEAGHAATAILMSGGRNVPDYASIVPGHDFVGIVMESVSYNDAGRNERSFADVRQKVRICLAGRVAEDLVLGPLEVSAGASSDLEKATRLALDAFGSWGFSPDMERAGGSGNNLAMVVGRWGDMDYERVYPLVRRFLADEYEALKALLAQHRALLDAITDRLMWDPLVDQQELAELCRQQGVPVVT